LIETRHSHGGARAEFPEPPDLSGQAARLLLARSTTRRARRSGFAVPMCLPSWQFVGRVGNLRPPIGVVDRMTVPGSKPAPRRIRPALGIAATAVLMGAGWLVGAVAAADVVPPAARLSSDRCQATRVHYDPYKGVQAGLARLPWIAASPVSTGLVGHLFYYDGLNAWRQQQLPRVRIYSGGQSPDGRASMKILWELRHGSALILRVQGKRLDGRGSFSQELSPAGSTKFQFPSIVTVPTPGCWRLTLQAGKTTGRITMLAVSGKTS
jgi:hypothetical protein